MACSIEVSSAACCRVMPGSEEPVRRALAIQLIINREWGLAANENPLQGSFIVDELTDLVEEAVLAEFEAISARGGVLAVLMDAARVCSLQQITEAFFEAGGQYRRNI
jgi:methylmalonyl-CoA mutase N-terminal domain/subunit